MWIGEALGITNLAIMKLFEVLTKCVMLVMIQGCKMGSIADMKITISYNDHVLKEEFCTNTFYWLGFDHLKRLH